MRVSKKSFADPYFINMMNWNCAPGVVVPKMDHWQLKKWVRAEFEVFKLSEVWSK